MPLLFLCLAAALVVARRPDALFHAQFWAEDGAAWFADAYNRGPLGTLALPRDGYFHLAHRLGGALGALVGLRWAPLLTNSLAILVQASPAAFFVTRRFSGVVPDVRVRALLAGLYLLMPNTAEIDANITNVQWHLDLLAAMVVLATPSPAAGWRAFDVGALVVSGLSGPFAILVLLVALARYAVRRERWTLVLAGVAAACVALQLLSLTSGVGTHRSKAPLGAGLRTLLAIVGAQVVTASMVGVRGYSAVVQAYHGRALLAGIGAAGLVVVGYAVLRGPLELKLFVFFAFAALAAALLSPQVDSVRPQWPQMLGPGVGGRYYLLPGLAFIACLAWLALRAPARWLRWAGRAALVVLIVVGVPLDFEYARYHDYHPDTEAAQFEQAPQGTRMIIPINPPGWSIQLDKK